MLLRCSRRKKDSRGRDYWSVVESHRSIDGRVVWREVLYMGEINAGEREAWRRIIEVQDAGTRRQVALFPAAGCRWAISRRLAALERLSPAGASSMGRVLAGANMARRTSGSGCWIDGSDRRHWVVRDLSSGGGS